MQGTGDRVSKKGNKKVAEDSETSITDRATAAKDAVVDKTSEESHDAKADAHKSTSHDKNEEITGC